MTPVYIICKHLIYTFEKKVKTVVNLFLNCIWTATESQPGSNDIGSQFASVQGVRGAGEWNLGWGQHTATQELADAFEEGRIPREDETLLYLIRNGKDDPESIPANKPYGEKPISNADVIAKYFNKKAYTDPAMRLKFTKGGYWVNIRLIRYADVVLMASEAACELGDLSSARNYLEMVRARARGNNIGILPEVTTSNQNELREAIRHERRVELGTGVRPFLRLGSLGYC